MCDCECVVYSEGGQADHTVALGSMTQPPPPPNEAEPTQQQQQQADEVAADRLCKAVYGYLRAIGERRHYNRAEVIERLNWCLANGATTNTLVHKYICLVRPPLVWWQWFQRTQKTGITQSRYQFFIRWTCSLVVNRISITNGEIKRVIVVSEFGLNSPVRSECMV